MQLSPHCLALRLAVTRPQAQRRGGAGGMAASREAPRAAAKASGLLAKAVRGAEGSSL